MNREFLAYYHTLEAEPGCSWTQLRNSYRRLVRMWHPDRFYQEPERRSLAEEKIKEINRAYQALSGYRDRHGSLPVDDSRHETRSPEKTQEENRPQDHQWSKAPAAVWADSDWPSPCPAPPAVKTSNLLRLVLIGLASWAAYALLWPQQPAPAPTPKTGHPFAGGNRPALTAPVPARVTNPTESDGFFTVGSTRDAVQAVQGLPTSIKNGVWYYGKSRVYFAQGTVRRWIDDPSSPLRVAFGNPRAPHQPTAFSIGSTKTLVRSVQGRPMLETTHEWDYGVSKVYFSDGRVTGWYNSPFTPLKTAR
ncbi:MAG: J domain-containing protein [Acidiferrobacterales bacterium]